MKEGWICPKCGKVLAPFIPQCDCYKQYRNEQTIYPVKTSLSLDELENITVESDKRMRKSMFIKSEGE